MNQPHPLGWEGGTSTVSEEGTWKGIDCSLRVLQWQTVLDCSGGTAHRNSAFSTDYINFYLISRITMRNICNVWQLQAVLMDQNIRNYLANYILLFSDKMIWLNMPEHVRIHKVNVTISRVGLFWLCTYI